MALDKVKIGVLDGASTGVKSDRYSIPSRTTDQRNAMSSPQPGDIIYNSTVGKLQQRTSENAWRTIDSPPVLSSISPTTSADGGTTITLTGSNFSSTISAVNFIGTNGTKYAASSYSRVSSTSVTAVTPDLLVAHEPYDVEITNDTGLSAILENSLDAGGAPSFTNYLAGLTGAGQANTGLIKSINDGQSTIGTLSAPDPDGGTVTYAATGTAVWSGRNISVASNGVVSGDPTNETGATTYTQQITATDAAGNTSVQNFQIYVVKEPTTSSPSNSGTFSTNSYTGYKTFQLKTATASTSTVANFITYGNTLCDIFMIGAGGNGGSRHGGGGGAGGAIKATGVFLTAATHACTAGAGAGLQASGDSSSTHSSMAAGGDTTITNIGGSVTWTAKGGGYGGNHATANNDGGAGGCGGGSGLQGNEDNPGGATQQASSHTPSSTVNGVSSTVAVYGFAGGDSGNGNRGGGGGGGCGAVGTSPDSTNTAGAGGTGITIDFWEGINGNTAATHRFGGGGGGGGHAGNLVPTNPGFGGGTGSSNNGTGSDGANGSGGGGGGGGGNSNTGARGGNGTIMFRIPYG